MSKWTARGKNFRPMGAFWSTNPEKAERTIKQTFNSDQKRSMARWAARKYRGYD